MRHAPTQDALYGDQEEVDERAVPQAILQSLHRETRRYPDLTFDLYAEAFECPACLGYCNCSLCSRKRGEQYISERGGGWRSWVARQGGSYRAAPTVVARTPASKSKSKSRVPGKAQAAVVAKRRATTTTKTTTTDAHVSEGSWSATAVFTVSGEPLGSALLARQQGPHRARVRPTSHSTPSCYHNHHNHQLDTRARAEASATAKTPVCVYRETAQGSGGVSFPSRIPSMISQRGRRGRGRRQRCRCRAADAGASGFDILSGA
ncbi:hypothetical protein BJY52DRAFT_207575 [Lactarius psammicola]|nr:hypothetical protein BJY52DRAFT_207575 [Lactarius psammicola]